MNCQECSYEGDAEEKPTDDGAVLVCGRCGQELALIIEDSTERGFDPTAYRAP